MEAMHSFESDKSSKMLGIGEKFEEMFEEIVQLRMKVDEIETTKWGKNEIMRLEEILKRNEEEKKEMKAKIDGLIHLMDMGPDGFVEVVKKDLKNCSMLIMEQLKSTISDKIDEKIKNLTEEVLIDKNMMKSMESDIQSLFQQTTNSEDNLFNFGNDMMKQLEQILEERTAEMNAKIEGIKGKMAISSNGENLFNSSSLVEQQLKTDGRVL
jgi:hypothetical protein